MLIDKYKALYNKIYITSYVANNIKINSKFSKYEKYWFNEDLIFELDKVIGECTIINTFGRHCLVFVLNNCDIHFTADHNYLNEISYSFFNLFTDEIVTTKDFNILKIIAYNYEKIKIIS